MLLRFGSIGCLNRKDFSEELANCSAQLFVLVKPRPKCTTAALQISVLLARAVEKGYLGEDAGEVLGGTKMPVKQVALLRQGLVVYLTQNLWMTVNHHRVLPKV